MTEQPPQPPYPAQPQYAPPPYEPPQPPKKRRGRRILAVVAVIVGLVVVASALDAGTDTGAESNRDAHTGRNALTADRSPNRQTPELITPSEAADFALANMNQRVFRNFCASLAFVPTEQAFRTFQRGFGRDIPGYPTAREVYDELVERCP